MDSRGKYRLRMTRSILSVMIIVLVAYSLFTHNLDLFPYITLLFGVFMVLFGLQNIKEKEKTKLSGYMYVLYVVIAFAIIILGSFILG